MNFRMTFLMEKRSRNSLRLTAVVALLLAVTLLRAFPSRPAPERLVNDLAGIFTPSQRQELESVLVAFDDSTSNQICVVTVNDLEGDSPASYAYRIGESWGVGDTGFDNGVVLLVKPKTGSSSGQVSIQVGYGLEGAIPDLRCKRIIDDVLIPGFREGDYYGAVYDACQRLMALASGEISQERDREDEIAEVAEVLVRLFIFFLVLFILVIVLKHNGNGNGGGGGRRDRHIYIGPLGGPWGSFNSGGSFGGFGGGGFGGGSGGFGGFGGGHFGGGGASGSW